MFRLPVAVVCALVALACALAPSRARADPDVTLTSSALPGSLRQWLESGRVEESKWSGEAELGYLATSGNANAQSAHTRSRIVNDRPNWRHLMRLEAIFADSQEEAPSQQYRASYKGAYKLTPDDYVFGLVRYDRNVSQGIRWRWAEVLGYGRRLFQGGGALLVLEAGAGGRQTRRTDSDSARREAVGVVLSELDWEIGAGSRFNEYVLVEAGQDNTLSLSQSALTLRVQGNLSARLSYDVTHNSSTPAGVRHTDTSASITLVYSF